MARTWANRRTGMSVRFRRTFARTAKRGRRAKVSNAYQLR